MPKIARSAGTVEYTDYTSAIPDKQCPEYDTEQSDSEAPVMELWEM